MSPGERPPRVVFVSACSAIDLHVIGRAASAARVVGIVRPDWDAGGARRPLATRAASLARRLRARPGPTLRGLERALEGPLRGRIAAGTEARVAALLRRDPAPPPPVLPVPFSAAALRRGRLPDAWPTWEPDLVVLSGAPILPEAVLSSLPLCLNLHYGVAPGYRGQHTLFWALREGDDDHLGGTLHRVDPGVDTGPVVARVFPALEAGDDEASLFAKTARLFADVIVELLRAWSPGAELRAAAQPPSPNPRRAYRFADRGLLDDAACALLRRARRGPRPRPARVEWSARPPFAQAP